LVIDLVIVIVRVKLLQFDLVIIVVIVTVRSLVQDLTTTFSLSGACQVGVADSMS